MRSRERGVKRGREGRTSTILLALPPSSLSSLFTHSLLVPHPPSLPPSLPTSLLPFLPLSFLPLSFPPSLFLSLPLHLSSCLTHALIFRSMGVSFLQEKRYLHHTSHLADWRVSGEGKKEQHYHSGLVLGHLYQGRCCLMVNSIRVHIHMYTLYMYVCHVNSVNETRQSKQLRLKTTPFFSQEKK